MALVEIRSALEKQIKTYADSKGLAVVWEGVSTIPSGNYIKVVIGDIGVSDPSFPVGHIRYKGVMRITAYLKDLNRGISPAVKVAEEIGDVYARGSLLTKDTVVVQIPNTPEIRSPGYSEGYIYLAIDIPFRSDVFKN